MTKTASQTSTITLDLLWTEDGRRDIEVPYRFSRSMLHMPEWPRYDVYIDDVHVGWVVRNSDGWDAFLTAAQDHDKRHEDFKGRRVAWGATTRRWAVEELILELRKGARCNVLASRAAVAYPEIDFD
jgi:hypothetical protein